MRKLKFLAVVLPAVMWLLTLGAADPTKTASSGASVYTKKCASCHGKQGEGVAKMATMLKTKIADIRGRAVTTDTLAAWEKITAEGKGKMPAFKIKMSAAEIDSSLAYMQLLAKATAKEPMADSAKGIAK